MVSTIFINLFHQLSKTLVDSGAEYADDLKECRGKHLFVGSDSEIHDLIVLSIFSIDKYYSLGPWIYIDHGCRYYNRIWNEFDTWAGEGYLVRCYTEGENSGDTRFALNEEAVKYFKEFDVEKYPTSKKTFGSVCDVIKKFAGKDKKTFRKQALREFYTQLEDR